MDSSDSLLARFEALHPKQMTLTRFRMQRLLTQLGHPERSLPPVIHVGGTNGKGSTVAIIRAILEAAGLSVHVYTSPHLVRFQERIRLGRVGGGRHVEEDRLVEAFRQCEAANGGAPITIFEMVTAAAFLLFADTPADMLLLEVGVGGRFDATNVIDAPAVAVVTPVGYDHADALGRELWRIAREKACIFKSGCPAVVAAQDYPEADAMLRERAERVGASPLLVGGHDFLVREESGRLLYQDHDARLALPRPRLYGRHQVVNAGTAIAALHAAGFKDFDNAVYAAGLTQADWPGRLQRLTCGSLLALSPAGSELWLDGAHNPDGARALAAAMADLHAQAGAPLVLIAGMPSRKDVEAFLGSFAGLATKTIAVPLPAQFMGRSAEEVAAIARRVGLVTSTAPSVEAALTSLHDDAFERPPRVLICGSLHLVGAVLARNGTPPQ